MPSDDERPTKPAPPETTGYSLVEKGRLSAPLPNRKLTLRDIAKPVQPPPRPWPSVHPLQVPPRSDRTLIGVAPPPAGSVAPPPELPSLSPPWPGPAATARDHETREHDRKTDYRRKDSPPPISLPPVGITKDGVHINKKALRWLMPAAIAVLALIGGYITGLWLAAKQMAANTAAIDDHEELERGQASLTRRQGETDQRIEETNDALKTEAQSNRAERATRDRRYEQIVESLPKIQGLPPPK
jgi:hypothetical protein